MALPNYYAQSPEEQILLHKAMQNFSQTGSYISPSGLNRNNATMMPLPPQYTQQNRYITREVPEMGPPSQEDIIEMFRDVKRNPTKYSQEDINMVKDLYQQMFGKSLFGAEDTNIANTLGNAAWELADTAAFGLLPDRIAENMGLRELNAADDIAKLAGMVGAFFVNPISPATTGTRVASKMLPKAAKFFKGAEGAAATTTKIPKFLQAAMGGKTEIAGGMGNAIGGFLENSNVARRVGSALGGGFNFETGVNPLGILLGSMFPGGKAPGVIPEGQQAANKILQEASSLDDFMSRMVSIGDNSGAMISPEAIASRFGVTPFAVKEAHMRAMKGVDAMRKGYSASTGNVIDEAFGVPVEDVIPAKGYSSVIDEAMTNSGYKTPSPTVTPTQTVSTPAPVISKNKQYNFGNYTGELTAEEAAKQLRDVRQADLEKIANHVHFGTGNPKNIVMSLIVEAKRNNPQMTLSQLFTLLQGL